MNDSNGDRPLGRLEIRADVLSLTPFAGLAVTGELARSVRLVELIDAEIAAETRVPALKRRRRGVSPGGLIVSLAETQLVGGDCFDDSEVLRADAAGASLRAVAQVPSAPTARQLAARLQRCQIQAAERALARAGTQLDRRLERDRSEPATVDLDATRITVYGAGKQGAKRTRTGELAYAPHIAFWAQPGRALTGELVGGNQEKLAGRAVARIARRAIRLLGAEHGPVDFRIDSAYYQLELLQALRKADARFSVSVPRNQAMWRIAAGIPEDVWSDAIEMQGAQIAETTYKPEGWKHEPLRLIVRRVPFSAERVANGSVRARRRKTIPPEQLQLAIDGHVETVYGYSFILADHPAQHDSAWVEHHHRHRAHIEERLKDAKLGQVLTDSQDGDGGVVLDGDEVAGNDRTTERPKGASGTACNEGGGGQGPCGCASRVETASLSLLIARRECPGGFAGRSAVPGGRGGRAMRPDSRVAVAGLGAGCWCGGPDLGGAAAGGGPLLLGAAGGG